MKGFQNIGNTCYLNSALQLILNIDSLCNFILNIRLKNTKINLLQELIKAYRTSDKGVINPILIKNLVSERKKMFGSYGQQDSSEFLIFLFDILDDEFKKNNLPGLNSLIGLKSNVSIKCKLKKCLHENNHNENNLFLHLPFTKSLTESYQKYKENEKLDGDNKIHCDSCKEKTISRKKIETSTWPDDLIIVINRYTNDLRKNNSKIDIPLSWRHNYKLTGGIIHSGGYGGGHYFYFGIKDSRWYIFNDSSIKIINSMDELYNLIQSSYILHYKK